MQHDIARIVVKIEEARPGSVRLIWEHHTLLVTEGPTLVERSTNILSTNDNITFTVGLDSESLRRLYEKEWV